jgi:hypothetical protein
MRFLPLFADHRWEVNQEPPLVLGKLKVLPSLLIRLMGFKDLVVLLDDNLMLGKVLALLGRLRLLSALMIHTREIFSSELNNKQRF